MRECGGGERTGGARASAQRAHLQRGVRRTDHASRAVERIVVVLRLLGQHLHARAQQLGRLAPVARLRRADGLARDAAHDRRHVGLKLALRDRLQAALLLVAPRRHAEPRAVLAVHGALGARDPPARRRGQLVGGGAADHEGKRAAGARGEVAHDGGLLGEEDSAALGEDAASCALGHVVCEQRQPQHGRRRGDGQRPAILRRAADDGGADDRDGGLPAHDQAAAILGSGAVCDFEPLQPGCGRGL